MSNNDGLNRILNIIDKQVETDVKRMAIMGMAHGFMVGFVIKPFPDLQIGIEGISNVIDDNIYLKHADGDLLLPEDIRLAKNDRVILSPLDRSSKWIVMFKLRASDTQPDSTIRFGWNGDKSTDTFVGAELEMPTSTENSDDATYRIHAKIIEITTISGGTVTVTGDTVTINGVNFSTHHHVAPGGGGNTGGPI